MLGFLSMLLAACGSVDAEVGDEGDGSPPDQTLIDDLEDGDSAIRPIDGREGQWFISTDGTPGASVTSTSQPEFPWERSETTNRYCAGLRGRGFTSWGVHLGVLLNRAADAATPASGVYDADRYEGVAFDAKGNVPIRVTVTTVATRGKTIGGNCEPVGTQLCNDFHGKIFDIDPRLWGTYTLRFDELAQRGTGVPVELDPATAVTVELEVDVDATVEFEICVDDLRFY